MVTSSQVMVGAEELRLDVLPKNTKRAFLRCIETPFFRRGDWYLAGGTALALQAGHRQSVDLDFFTTKKAFDEKKIEEQLDSLGTWKTTSLSRGTVYGEFMNAKMSLIAYPFFTPAQPFIRIGSVNILTLPDIAVMKITAISQRGRKRDFFDLYWLSNNGLPLRESMKRVQHQYSIRQNFNHILKSLVYFDDAEGDPEPEINFDANWKTVKAFFQKEILLIMDKLI